MSSTRDAQRDANESSTSLDKSTGSRAKRSESSKKRGNSAGRALAKAGSSAAKGANGARKSVAGGLSAMREVRHAAKQRSDALADLREIRRGLEEDRNEYAHRREVEQNFDKIVSTQEAEIKKAMAEAKRAANEAKKQEENVERLKEELREMRERHEQKLRPYRNLMESSRGRSDDAAKALADARRATRRAEADLSAATKRRDQRMASAQRAVDNAQERLNRNQEERVALRTETGDGAALAKVEAERETLERSLATAREDVTRTMQESQESVDLAQKALWKCQRELSSVEKSAADAKAEATTHKEEYDGLYKEAQAKEKSKEDVIKSCESRIRDLNKTREAAIARANEARDILNEAKEIHAHPETTQGLRERIADEEDDLEALQAEVDELTAAEQDLRRSTRGTRFVFIAIVVVALAIVLFLVWFFVLRPH